MSLESTIQKYTQHLDEMNRLCEQIRYAIKLFDEKIATEIENEKRLTVARCLDEFEKSFDMQVEAAKKRKTVEKIAKAISKLKTAFKPEAGKKHTLPEVWVSLTPQSKITPINLSKTAKEKKISIEKQYDQLIGENHMLLTIEDFRRILRKLRREILTAKLQIEFDLHDSGKRASITEEIEKRIAETIVSRK